MAGKAAVLVRRVRQLGFAGLAALAMSASLLGAGSGVAGADDLKPNPSKPSGHPACERCVRSPSTHGEVRAADIGDVLAQGDARTSDKGVPVTKGHSPLPGNLSQLGYDCLQVWSQFCR